MTRNAAFGLALIALALLPACSPGTAALIRCALVDHDVNRRCH